MIHLFWITSERIVTRAAAENRLDPIVGRREGDRACATDIKPQEEK